MDMRGRALTRREAEIFDLVGSGKSAKEIAAIAGISFRTIEVHTMRIREKLGVHNIKEALLHYEQRRQRRVILDLRATLASGSEAMHDFDEICARHGLEPWTWPAETGPTHA
jgi:DNA-binding CsgD family transcriptional regulator